MRQGPSWPLAVQVFNTSVARRRVGKRKVLPEKELGGWDAGGPSWGLGQYLFTNLSRSIQYFNNIYSWTCAYMTWTSALLLVSILFQGS